MVSGTKAQCVVLYNACMCIPHDSCIVVHYTLPVEALFGTPPFASKTLEELEMKLLDTKPIEVSIIRFV